ncbi:PQQ-dependent sugar dehydrogenase [Chlorogloeopsis fritschii PCC 9212]|uniref:Oxidoreductase n=1 Tax=Chlorogloeopsis fritschii PCC 6912 TaxID=211165 RepID=A0A433MWP2_CHLFR|nr:PQQ-dependent sugar dehydrogenase [Chlorogloeopsis fritschii]RUR72458.1 oxidoreductase [Chlorogloeopsis fritschii PCC 6912]
MKYSRNSTINLFFCLSLTGLVACNNAPATLSNSNNENQAASPAANTTTAAQTQACIYLKDGFGSQGQVKVRVEEVVTGLEVPWGIAFLPGGDMLVTERPGRVRLVRNGKLQQAPVNTVKVTDSGEGGLLGIAAHPNFANNRFFYLYYTVDKNGSPVNRVERWRLSTDGVKASRDRIIIDDIPAAIYHNGGRLRFGPDGMLYIGTGDGREPKSSQNIDSLAGKILRLTPDGQVPKDNPFPNNPAFITGIRNTQGFDWPNQSTLWVTDHGPSGDLGRTGHDEVSVATAGDNLGWPDIYGCESQKGMVVPSLTWQQAVPPGGAAIYTGNTIPEWKGNLIIGTLGSRHLHRVVFDSANRDRVQLHEVYFQNQFGRLREVAMGLDGELYVTTSNCDGRGNCPQGGDKILRITR